MEVQGGPAELALLSNPGMGFFSKNLEENQEAYVLLLV